MSDRCAAEAVAPLHLAAGRLIVWRQTVVTVTTAEVRQTQVSRGAFYLYTLLSAYTFVRLARCPLYPDSDQVMVRNGTLRCARSGLTLRSKRYRYSITSSARATSVAGS